MTRSLADMIDDDTMEGMAISAGQKGTEGWQVREMYGIERPDGRESLRDALRHALTDNSYTIANQFGDYQVNPHMRRILEMKALKPVDLAAVSAWADDAVSIEVERDLEMTFLANPEQGLSIRIHFGSGPRAIWDFKDIDVEGGTIKIHDHRLPETVLDSLAGRPLDDALDHPLTRGAGLVIDRAYHYAADDATCLDIRPAEPEGEEN